jgi:hypothetical protein
MKKKKKAFKRKPRIRKDLTKEKLIIELNTDRKRITISPASDFANQLFHDHPFTDIVGSGICVNENILAGIDAVSPAKADDDCLYKLYHFDIYSDNNNNIICSCPGVSYEEHHRNDIPDYFFRED